MTLLPSLSRTCHPTPHSGGHGTKNGCKCFAFGSLLRTLVVASASNTRRHSTGEPVMQHRSVRWRRIGASTCESSIMTGCSTGTYDGFPASIGDKMRPPSVQRLCVQRLRIDQCSQSSSIAWTRASWSGRSMLSASRNSWMRYGAPAWCAPLPSPTDGLVIFSIR